MGLFRNASLVNQKNSGSWRCICRKLRVGRRMLRWCHLILRWVLQRRASHRDSTSCPWISTEAEFLLDAWVTLVLSYLLGCCSVGSLEETALLDLENRRCRVFLRRQGSPSVELSIDSAVGPFAQPRSSMRRKERAVFRWTKDTFRRLETGVCYEHQIGFYETSTKPRMRVI